jgi:uncharacterized RmlC-like cupin family protein
MQPEGQTEAHCPQQMQALAAISAAPFGATNVSSHLVTISSTPTERVLQTSTHSPHNVHLFGSSTMLSELLSIGSGR